MKSIVFLFIFASTVVYAADEVTYLENGGKVPSVSPFDFRFNYNADANRDCEIAIKKPSEGWKQYAWKRISCQGGVGQMKVETLTWDHEIPVGSGYIIEIKFLSGSTLTGYYTLDITIEKGFQGFYTSNGEIFDANGKKFLMRGVNNMHIFWDSYDRWYALDALKAIAATKANTVRIVWVFKDTQMNAADLDKIIYECIKQKLVPMVGMFDGTCVDNAEILLQMARWLANNSWLLVKYRKYIMVNIANEWGYTKTLWRDTYKQAISMLRNAGYSGNLVIDSTECAHSPLTPKMYGQELIDHDPFKNIVFSIHMYAQWGPTKPDYVFDYEFYEYKTKKLPLIIGEFASRHPDKKSNGECYYSNLNVTLLMREALNFQVGYLGWVWCGNGEHDCPGLKELDVVSNFNWNSNGQYTRWGNELINTFAVGIRDTSVRATIFA